MPSCKHKKEVDWILNTFKHSKHTLSSIPFLFDFFFLWGPQTCKYFFSSFFLFFTHWWWTYGRLHASSVAFMGSTYFDVYIVQTFYYIFLSHMLLFTRDIGSELYIYSTLAFKLRSNFKVQIFLDQGMNFDFPFFDEF